MAWIRRCEDCGCTFSPMDGDDSTLCPDCSGSAGYRVSWTSGRIVLLVFTIAKTCVHWFIRLALSLVSFIFNNFFWSLIIIIFVVAITSK